MYTFRVKTEHLGFFVASVTIPSHTPSTLFLEVTEESDLPVSLASGTGITTLYAKFYTGAQNNLQVIPTPLVYTPLTAKSATYGLYTLEIPANIAALSTDITVHLFAPVVAPSAFDAFSSVTVTIAAANPTPAFLEFCCQYFVPSTNLFMLSNVTCLDNAYPVETNTTVAPATVVEWFAGGVETVSDIFNLQDNLPQHFSMYARAVFEGDKRTPWYTVYNGVLGTEAVSITKTTYPVMPDLVSENMSLVGRIKVKTVRSNV